METCERSDSRTGGYDVITDSKRLRTTPCLPASRPRIGSPCAVETWMRSWASVCQKRSVWLCCCVLMLFWVLPAEPLANALPTRQSPDWHAEECKGDCSADRRTQQRGLASRKRTWSCARKAFYSQPSWSQVRAYQLAASSLVQGPQIRAACRFRAVSSLAPGNGDPRHAGSVLHSQVALPVLDFACPADAKGKLRDTQSASSYERHHLVSLSHVGTPQLPPPKRATQGDYGLGLHCFMFKTSYWDVCRACDTPVLLKGSLLAYSPTHLASPKSKQAQLSNLYRAGRLY